MSKRKYNSWREADMEQALEMYKNKTIGFNEACRSYNIPKPTFRRHVKNLNKHKSIGRPKDLSSAMEVELVQHILRLESCFFGLTIKDLRHLAFQLAEKYELHHRFNKQKQLAGWKWYYKFMRDHPEISLRMPESTSMARCRGFNKQRVMDFFDKYEDILDKEKLLPNQVYNVDESGLSTVHKPSKILAKKGKHQVGAVTSGERGTNTTCVCCMNAAGEYIPPMLIFKRKRMTDVLKRAGPPNTLYSCSDSGWITSELFLDWIQHFIKWTRLEKSDTKQVLLLLDGHSTHTKNIDAIRLAREYGIILLSLPAHTSHRLQPLDKSFFKSLKHHFNAVSATWMRSHPGNVIKQTDISELLGVAYPRAACMSTALHGFEACGLWPADRHKIKEEEYVVVENTGETEGAENHQKNTEHSVIIISDENIAEAVNSGDSENTIETINTLDDPQPSTSSHILPQADCATLEELAKPGTSQVQNAANQPSTSTQSTTIPHTPSTQDTSPSIRAQLQELSPIPRIVQNKLSRGTTASQILTESPYKNDLENKIDNNKRKKVKLNLTTKTTGIVTTFKKPHQTKIVGKKKGKAVRGKNDNMNWYCILCDENIKESMIQCTHCKVWVHDMCAGVDKGTVNYQCDKCSN